MKWSKENSCDFGHSSDCLNGNWTLRAEVLCKGEREPEVDGCFLEISSYPWSTSMNFGSPETSLEASCLFREN